jgi:hypothetical protein
MKTTAVVHKSLICDLVAVKKRRGEARCRLELNSAREDLGSAMVRICTAV